MKEIEPNATSKIIPSPDILLKTIVCASIGGVAALILAKLTEIGYDKAAALIHTKPAELNP